MFNNAKVLISLAISAGVAGFAPASYAADEHRYDDGRAAYGEATQGMAEITNEVTQDASGTQRAEPTPSEQEQSEIRQSEIHGPWIDNPENPR